MSLIGITQQPLRKGKMCLSSNVIKCLWWMRGQEIGIWTNYVESIKLHLGPCWGFVLAISGSLGPRAEAEFSLVSQSCATLRSPMDCSTPGLHVHHQVLELALTHAHWVDDAIQPSHLLSSPSPPAFNLSQHQGLFQGVSSLHQVAKVLEFQLQPQSFQWIFKTDFL